MRKALIIIIGSVLLLTGCANTSATPNSYNPIALLEYEKCLDYQFIRFGQLFSQGTSSTTKWTLLVDYPEILEACKDLKPPYYQP